MRVIARVFTRRGRGIGCKVGQTGRKKEESWRMCKS